MRRNGLEIHRPRFGKVKAITFSDYQTKRPPLRFNDFMVGFFYFLFLILMFILALYYFIVYIIDS